MAKSREIPTPDPVNESETEESETDDSGSESESDSEKNAPPTTPPAEKLQKPVGKAAAPAATSSDEESGSECETDSESDSPPNPDKVAVAPPTQLKKPSTSSAVAVKTPAKRAAETPSLTQDTKRSKKAEGIEEGKTEEGKKLFERVFNPKDQIIVLEELLKRYPISITKDSPQMDDLYECIKEKVSVPVSKAQVKAKIKRMRVKFFNKKKIAMEKSAITKTKGRKKKDNVEDNGKDETESRVYELSNQIWGNEEGPKSAMKGLAKIALKIEEPMGKDEKKEETMGKVTYASNGGSVEEWVFGEGTKLVAQEVKGELEEEWKKVRKEEARLLVERLELSLKHAKVVYNSL